MQSRIVCYIFLFITLCCLLSIKAVISSKSSSIPKIIWTYWDSNTPPIIQKFVHQWRVLNPLWDVRFLNKTTIQNYISTNELPKGFYKNIETPQHSSDIIRVCLLHKYGGLWIDASTIMLKPIKEFDTRYDYVGYFMPSFSNSKEKPIVENWYMASKPNTKFLEWVKKEMFIAFGRRKKYIENNLEYVQKIPKGLQNYLWMHVIINKVLHEKDIDMQRFHLISAYKDAYALHGKFDWDSKRLIDYLKTDDFKLNKENYGIIKLRSAERNAL